MITTEELRQQAEAVARARANNAEAKAVVASARELFERENATALATAKHCAEMVTLAEDALRVLLVGAGKGKHIGGETKEYDTIAYDDATAFAWATEHKVCLSLDKKAFEKIAKASPLPFVALGKELRASLASDMDKALSSDAR